MNSREKLKKYIREIMSEMMKETSNSGGVEGYSTPFAFAGKKKSNNIKRRKLASVLGYQILPNGSLHTDKGSNSSGGSVGEDLELERKLTSSEIEKKEKNVKSMKPVSKWEKKYPGKGKEVMYATATKLAKESADQSYPSKSYLDGMSKQKAKSTVYNIASQYIKGIFPDDNWARVRKIFSEIRNKNISVDMIDVYYGKGKYDSTIPQTRKTWVFEISFTDNKGKPVTLHGKLIASGAGSVQDPLDEYDIVFIIE